MITTRRYSSFTPSLEHHKLVARAWTAWTNNGAPRETRPLGTLIDKRLRLSLPDGVLRGTARGYEDEIRQEAAELLFKKFLRGNRKLALATAAGDSKEIVQQINRSTSAALRFTRGRLLRRLSAETRQREALSQTAPTDESVRPFQPEERPGQIPRLQLARAGIDIALERGLITEESAGWTRSLLDGTRSQADIARDLGVSRSAVNQRVHATTKHLRKIIAREEVTL